MKNITIGLTIFVKPGPVADGPGSLDVFSCGAHGNVLALWQLFNLCTNVRCVLVNGGNGEKPDPATLPEEFRGAEFARFADVAGEIDVLAQCGAQISAAEAETVRARGGKVIAIKFGSDFAIDLERAIHNLPSGGILNGTRFDEVWTTSQHVDLCGAYWETLYHCPVRVLPHVWSPAFVDAGLTECARAFPSMPRGYVWREGPKRVTSVEPSINWCKTAHGPMLICELAYRERPDLFEAVKVCNSIHMAGRLPFETFVGALDIAKPRDGGRGPVMTFEGRYALPWFMSAHADVLVSHQHIMVPNYSHYDAISMGFPLVHNVPELQSAGVGYYYHRHDFKAGARALIDAMTEDADGAKMRQECERRYLEGVKCTAPKNIEAHAKALQEVMR